MGLIDNIISFISIIGAIASIISAWSAFKSKRQAERILKEIEERNIDVKGNIAIKNEGNNSGIMSGASSGEIHYGNK